jgi:hypothetical protein
MPITAALRYVRGPGNSRWHRPRSGYQHPNGRVCVNFWCGPYGSDGPGIDRLLYVDEVPAGEPVCGTCVGRALGAGQDEVPPPLPKLRFDPRWVTPPARCPGSRSRTLWVAIPGGHHNIGRCLACDLIVPIRVVGRGYNAWGGGPTNHTPGPGLIEPCPFHAWNRVDVRDGVVGCACGWPPVPDEAVA